MDGLTEGRKVHYVMPNGKHCPAEVVRVWGENGCSNLQVITDGPNDAPYGPTEENLFANFGISPAEVKHGHFWRTSVMFSEEPKPGTWHWIEKA
ncbi:MAG: hypothetical protein PHQ40_00390 [Anaerolineaceae bacterium]|nr:hypothetical protein [Anaerolineaceae bacterium]MDD5367514.1 hypothetical protein [Anaerolineaceae bacterium]